MLFNEASVWAITDELIINCNPGPEAADNCDVTPSNTAPLFNEADYPLFDLKPGDEINREITVNNNRDEVCYFTLVDATNVSDTETPPGSGNYFSDRLETIITDGTDSTGLITFSSLFGLSDIYLATLPAFSSKTLDWDVFFDANAGNEYQNARLEFDFTWNFQCGDEPPQTVLNIFKTNNKLPPIVQEPGAQVTYTIEVSTEEFPVYNVFVLDLPPGGFVYRPGSWTASSTEPRAPGNQISLTDPYASPGKWDLGDMVAGETVTLTYITDIDDDQQPGTYKDIAWTEGTLTSDPGSSRVLGVSTVDNTTFFVGTAAIVEQENPPEVQVEPEEEIIEITEGDVLGAQLPATGADNYWMFIVVNLFGAGVILTLLGLYLRNSHKKGKIMMHVFLIFTAALLLATKVYAADFLIRIEEPKDPNNLNSLDLNFVVMEIDNNPITVKCFKKGPGDAVFSQFGPNIAIPAGGGTDYCPVSSSILSGMGNYEFYTVAYVGGDSEPSQTVTIEHDDESPGKPHDLDKDSNGSCKYDISFTTDDDGGDTTRVEVYRSDDKEFYVNDSTKIKDINVGSNTDVDFTDDRPTCGKTYYYAARAFDAAGNGSKVLVEELEKEVITVITEGETTTEETVFGPLIVEEGAAVGVGGEGAEGEEVVGEEAEEEQVLGVEEQAEGTEETAGAFSGLRDLLAKYKWPIVIVLLLIIYFYVRKKRKNNKKPQNPQQY
jgi:uncharacterized repeat protein (TIGR01451 family)